MTEDNLGNKMVDPPLATPIAASGQRLTNATANTNTTLTVGAGKTYVFTSLIAGGFYFSITGTVATAANVEWVCPLYQSIIIKIPEAITTLNYATDTTNGIGYLRELSF